VRDSLYCERSLSIQSSRSRRKQGKRVWSVGTGIQFQLSKIPVIGEPVSHHLARRVFRLTVFFVLFESHCDACDDRPWIAVSPMPRS